MRHPCARPGLTRSNRRRRDPYARWRARAAPRGSSGRDPKVSDLLAGRLLIRQYEVSGALEHAPKTGVGSQADRSINAGSIRREARAVPVARHLGPPADRLALPGLPPPLFHLGGPLKRIDGILHRHYCLRAEQQYTVHGNQASCPSRGRSPTLISDS